MSARFTRRAVGGAQGGCADFLDHIARARVKHPAENINVRTQTMTSVQVLELLIGRLLGLAHSSLERFILFQAVPLNDLKYNNEVAEGHKQGSGPLGFP